jgi:hypothetical protein
VKLSRNEQAKKFAQRALRALSGFAKSFKLKYQDIEVGVDLASEAGLTDKGSRAAVRAVLYKGHSEIIPQQGHVPHKGLWHNVLYEGHTAPKR